MIRSLTSALTLASLAACSSASSPSITPAPQSPSITIELTDAPTDYLATANVDIGAITIHRTGNDAAADDTASPGQDAGWIEIVADGGTHNLLELQGVTADLGTAILEEGNYNQIRMEIESASVDLAPGYMFDDGTTQRTLDITGNSVLKFHLFNIDGGRGLELTPGETVLVIDFDVSENFIAREDRQDPSILRDVRFNGNLRATVADIAGSVSGTVTAVSSDQTDLIGTEVKAQLIEPAPPGSEEVIATGLVSGDGSYQINYLTPGTYEVYVPAFGATPIEVVIDPSEDETGIHFTEPSAP